MKSIWKKIIVYFCLVAFVVISIVGSSTLAAENNTSTDSPGSSSNGSKLSSIRGFFGDLAIGSVFSPYFLAKYGSKTLKTKAGQSVVQATMDVLAIVLAQIQLLVSTILQLLMNFMDFLLGSTGAVLDNKGVHSGWTQVRDLCNMLFIFILLGIAFMTVFFGTEGTSYSIKKALPLLIIAVLTINFSFFICKVIVEGTDIAARSLIAEEETGALGDIMGIKKMGTVSVPSSSEWGEGMEGILLEGESSAPAGPGGTSTSGSSSE